MASIMKRGKSWQIRSSYIDAHGKRKFKSKAGFKTKKEAQLYITELEKEKSVDLSLTDTTFKGYFDEWAATYRLPNIVKSTARWYSVTSNEIEKHFGLTDIRDITRRDYQTFINKYGKHKAKGSVKKLHSLIRACVQNAAYEDVIPKDFTKGIILTYNKSRTRKVDYLNMDELHKLVTYLLNDLTPRYTSRYMILTALYTGARLGEIMALTWDDINFNFKTITINKAWAYENGGGFKPTKNESSNRVIRVNNEFLKIIKELKVNNSKMVFMNHIGTIPSSSAVNKTLRKALKDLDINREGFHFHSLRHSHVAFLLANNVDLYVISKRLGHSEMGTTSNIYAYLIEEYKARYDDHIDDSLENLTLTSTKKRKIN
ncbi:site-specific integrase [Lactiplantibacillus paraxiangfangensis]|uniref:site-specific integrase n=1 Tax=Lactiplantibacillus paraxiangfangensis TaxID=3076224 RepID=UPI0030C6E0E9